LGTSQITTGDTNKGKVHRVQKKKIDVGTLKQKHRTKKSPKGKAAGGGVNSGGKKFRSLTIWWA